MKLSRFIVCAVLLAALTGCKGTDRNSEETDVIETASVSVVYSEEQTKAVSEIKPVSLGQYSNLFTVYRLNFYGEQLGADEYEGTLCLDMYNTDEEGRVNELTASCTVYDNERFVFCPPENGGVYSSGTYIVIENNIPEGDGVRRQFRFFSEDGGELFEFTHQPCERLPMLLADKGRAIVMENPVYNSYGVASDYGSERFVEFEFSHSRRRTAVTGAVDFIPMDEELLADAREADLREELIYVSMYSDFSQSFELIGSDELREETYYRVPEDIARNADGLYAYYLEYCTERYVDMDREEFYEKFFGGEHPLFREDGQGLVLIDFYKGVPIDSDYDTARLISIDDSTAELVVRGNSLDGELICRQNYIREDGKWKLDSSESCDAGLYFALNEMVYTKGWSWFECDFDTIDFKVGETREAIVSIRSQAEMFCDENGCPYVISVCKADDEAELDLSALNVSGGVFESLHDEETGERVPNPHIPAFGFTPDETGEYVVRIGWKCIGEDGGIIEIVSGPKSFYVSEGE